jgi:5'-deoxynucleotidase
MIKVQDIRRIGHVSRWHMVRTQRVQTLGEHLFTVTFLSNHLAKNIVNDMTSENMVTLMEYSMRSDLGELAWGDCASHLKAHIDKMTDNNNPIRQLEDDIDPECYQLKLKLKGTPFIRIAKLADIIDALVFLYNEGVDCRESRLSRLRSKNVLRSLRDAGVLNAEQWEKADLELSSLESQISESHCCIVFKKLYDNFCVELSHCKADFDQYDWTFADEVLSDMLYEKDSQIGLESTN